MLAPIVFHIVLKTPVLPVKCTPARSRCDNATSEITEASPATLLAVNESFYRYPFHLFTDTPFLVGVLLFLLGYEVIFRGPAEDTGRPAWSPWVLMALGTLLMVSTRPAVWTFLAALAAAIAWHVVRGPRWMRVRHSPRRGVRRPAHRLPGTGAPPGSRLGRAWGR